MQTTEKDSRAKLAQIEEQISSLISQMTLEEKVSLCHGNTLFKTAGVERLGIPPIVTTDGPHGIRQEFKEHKFETTGQTDDFVSYFCSLIALAATWNDERAYDFGSGMGQEARARGKDVVLGPGINIMRSPLCGRNFEYLSEDPYLISRIAVPYIKGVQQQNAAACVKHFAANNQETNRLSVSVEMDERALREIYLPGFKACVEEGGAFSVMGAYNKLKGQYCCHNEYLLKTILKGEWGFDGAVISDWSGTHDTVEAANNGLDIEMGTEKPYNEFYLADALVEAVKNGLVEESIVDDKVRRALRLRFKTGMFDENRCKGSYNTAKHQKVSLDIAREAITLLKNENGILPLDEVRISSIAVIGDNAVKKHASGGQSSEVKALYEISPLEGLEKRLDGKIKINYARGYSESEAAADMLMEEAIKAAAMSDVAVVFAGLNHNFDTEASDRTDMSMPYRQPELIQRVYEANPNTIVVMISGLPVEMEPWVKNVPALLQVWYCGMEGGNAMAEVLFGDVNPSGKLPVTFPARLEDCSAHSIGEFPGKDTVEYKEGIFVGYRHFDTNKIEPLFCFGHGLSYTAFEYSGLKITPHSVERGQSVEVSFCVTNSGEREGGETAQVYIRDVESSLVRPEKELKGFKKVFLKPGETKELSIMLDESSMSFYNDKTGGWMAEPGAFEVLAGGSSRDIRLKGGFELKK